MSGPLQWTAGGFVPANGMVPNAGVTQAGAVAETTTTGGFVEYEPTAVRRPVMTVSQSPVTKSINVLALAKARLKVVKSELRRMYALEKEKGELERLIAAAESKPAKSNLREIKRSIG